MARPVYSLLNIFVFFSKINIQPLRSKFEFTILLGTYPCVKRILFREETINENYCLKNELVLMATCCLKL